MNSHDKRVEELMSQNAELLTLLRDVWRLQQDKSDLMPDFMTGDLIARFERLFGGKS